MRKTVSWFGHGLMPGGFLSLAALAVSGSLAYSAAAPAPTQAMDDLLKNNCIECHNTTDWTGGLALDTLELNDAGQEPEVWEKAINKLRGRLMPPAGKKQPSQADVDALVGYLESSIDNTQEKTRQVGHVPLQRLSRVEYAASIKELLGVDIDPRQALPNEIEVEGFSNIASAKSTSPAFMEQYISATRRAVKLALGEPVPKLAKVTVPVTAAPLTAFPLGTRGVNAGGGGSGGFVFGGGRCHADGGDQSPSQDGCRRQPPAHAQAPLWQRPRPLHRLRHAWRCGTAVPRLDVLRP